MRSFIPRAMLLIFLLGLSAACIPAQQEQEINMDLKSGKVVIRRLLILPAEASITKLSMSGAVQAVDEERQTEKRLAEAVEGVMLGKEERCDVLEDEPDATAQNENARDALITLQNNFDQLLPHLERNSKNVRKGRFTLGDEVLNFAPSASVDALIFVHAEGMLATGGKKAFSALVGGPGADFLRIRVAVVDSRNGAVLYFGKAYADGNFVEDPDHLNALALNSLIDFPGPHAAKKHK